MLIDITLPITLQMTEAANKEEKKSLAGHIGTHFDVMDKQFPLEYTKRNGIIFDVSHIKNRDICSADIDLNKVKKDMFVAFCSGFIETEKYGSKAYFSEHPELSDELIDKLLEKEISMIGIDFAGVRRGKEHTPKDAYCAKKNVFIVENLCNLKEVLSKNETFTANTYPINCTELTGLPCRVVAEVGANDELEIRRTEMFRELTRKKKQISMQECIDVLATETRGVLSVIGDDDYPYGTPMNHFYNEADEKIYFHCGKVGHRLDALRKNDKVSFCVYDRGYRKEGDWALTVKSVIVFGRIEIIDDMRKIIDISRKLSHKFTQDEEYINNEIEKYAHETLLLKLTPEHICGKLVTES